MFRSDVAELSEQFTELEKKNSQAVIGIGPDLSLHYRSGSSRQLKRIAPIGS